MADRLIDVVLGLQRMAEGVQQRGADLRYAHQCEDAELIADIDQLIGMVDKVRAALWEERKKLMPAKEDNVQRLEERQAKAVGRTPAG